MAVLIEAISVVILRASLMRAFEGNWEEFAQAVPNDTMCSDDELVRVGFMTPHDVEHYVRQLQAKGLSYLEREQAIDVVVVDQMRGPMARCKWAEFGHVALDHDEKRRIAVCRLQGSNSSSVATPNGWSFGSSLSASYSFVPSTATEKALKFLRSEDGLDVYWSQLSRKEVYVGRTNRETP
jgi:hypothetical protein